MARLLIGYQLPNKGRLKDRNGVLALEFRNSAEQKLHVETVMAARSCNVSALFILLKSDFEFYRKTA